MYITLYFSTETSMAPNSTLKTVLFSSGTTQLTVAQRTGIHESRLSKIIRGHVEPSETERKLIARVLRKPILELFPHPLSSEAQA
jgi:transcriptional regulator with XRE-family HTH domain